MTKETIITAALRLFLLRGYQSVSLADVAKEAGITKGGIYHYFSGKEELLQVALQYFLDSFEKKYQALLAGATSLRDLWQLLYVDNVMVTHGRSMLGCDQSSPIDHIHFIIDIMRRFPAAQERIERYQQTLTELLAAKIEEAAAVGEIRSDVDSQALAVIMMAVMNGTRGLGNEGQPPASLMGVADAFWTMIRV